MLIQCGGCGLMANVKHKETAEEIEQSIADTIESGWRWCKSHDMYLCPNCSKNGIQDKLYLAFVGKKVRKCNKANSYMRLLIDMNARGYFEP